MIFIIQNIVYEKKNHSQNLRIHKSQLGIKNVKKHENEITKYLYSLKHITYIYVWKFLE